MEWLVLSASGAALYAAGRWAVGAAAARRRGGRRSASAPDGDVAAGGPQPLRAVVARCEARWFLEDLRLANAGDAGAMVRVSHMLLAGYGTRQDPAAAAAWMRQAWALQNLKEPAEVIATRHDLLDVRGSSVPALNDASERGGGSSSSGAGPRRQQQQRQRQHRPQARRQKGAGAAVAAAAAGVAAAAGGVLGARPGGKGELSTSSAAAAEDAAGGASGGQAAGAQAPPPAARPLQHGTSSRQRQRQQQQQQQQKQQQQLLGGFARALVRRLAGSSRRGELTLLAGAP